MGFVVKNTVVIDGGWVKGFVRAVMQNALGEIEEWWCAA